MTKVWRVYGDGQDLHLALEAETPLEAKTKTLFLFPRFFFVGIKQLEMTLDPKREEREGRNEGRGAKDTLPP